MPMWSWWPKLFILLYMNSHICLYFYIVCLSVHVLRCLLLNLWVEDISINMRGEKKSNYLSSKVSCGSWLPKLYLRYIKFIRLVLSDWCYQVKSYNFHFVIILAFLLKIFVNIISCRHFFCWVLRDSLSSSACYSRFSCLTWWTW